MPLPQSILTGAHRGAITPWSRGPPGVSALREMLELPMEVGIQPGNP
ncbi:MAG: hypothetical protein CM15mP103_12170 [Gammaproteobacteria bacterium]|nr:MAG: hypothetical protein CM15mP103_12170 [Gammaproteobacteria bacterium]